MALSANNKAEKSDKLSTKAVGLADEASTLLSNASEEISISENKTNDAKRALEQASELITTALDYSEDACDLLEEAMNKSKSTSKISEKDQNFIERIRDLCVDVENKIDETDFDIRITRMDMGVRL
jgi:hypothetical protein